MQFADIIGQERIKKALRRLVDEGKIPHALMFTGAQGVGKLPLAIATAQYVCCENRHDGDSCGECRSCLQFAKLAHPDVNYVFPIVKEKIVNVCDDLGLQFRDEVVANPYLSIDQWLASVSSGKMGSIYTSEAQEILRKVSFKPYQSQYKVLIIWMPEKMHEACANSLLKLLEEPPVDTVFMLVADNPELIISTITSRCRQFAVPPIISEDMESAMNERFDLSDEKRRYLLRNSMGSWNRMMELMNQSDDERENFELFVRMMRLSWNLNIPDIRTWVDELASLGRERCVLFLQNAQRLIRENFILRLQVPELSYMSADEAKFAAAFSQFIHECNVVQIMEELELAERQIQQNVSAKIVFFHLVILLYKLLHKPRS